MGEGPGHDLGCLWGRCEECEWVKRGCVVWVCGVCFGSEGGGLWQQAFAQLA